PDALTISFMTRADSHPWHVRWPEVKYSSRVTRLTPLKGSRICVALVNVSAISSLLVARPPDLRVCSAGLRPPRKARYRSPDFHIRSARLWLRLARLAHARLISIFARLAFGCASQGSLTLA